MNDVVLKKLREMSLKQQLLFVESYLPDAWDFMQDVAKLPMYDDNDDLVKEDNHATSDD
jgi:hypothetical protein